MSELTIQHAGATAVAFEDDGDLDATTVHEIVSANPRPGDLVFRHLGGHVAWVNASVHDVLLNGQVIDGVSPAGLGALDGLKVEHSSGLVAVLTSQGDLHLRGVVV